MDNLLGNWPLCTPKNLRAGIYNILYLLRKILKIVSSFYDTETFGDQLITVKSFVHYNFIAPSNNEFKKFFF